MVFTENVALLRSPSSLLVDSPKHCNHTLELWPLAYLSNSVGLDVEYGLESGEVGSDRNVRNTVERLGAA